MQQAWETDQVNHLRALLAETETNLDRARTSVPLPEDLLKWENEAARRALR